MKRKYIMILVYHAKCLYERLVFRLFKSYRQLICCKDYSILCTSFLYFNFGKPRPMPCKIVFFILLQIIASRVM